MKDTEFLTLLHEAFDKGRPPSGENIVHCSYDRKWGGELDGPCRECAGVVEYFKGKEQYQHNPVRLGWVAFGLVPLTPEAFAYWLPGFLEAVILHPSEADSVAESLEFRFQSLEREDWQNSHIGCLSQKQLEVLKAFFRIQKDRKAIDGEEFNKVMATLERFHEKRS